MTDMVIPANHNADPSPLPAFFYGGGETGPAGVTDPSAPPRQPVPIDRRTLLGLVAGTGMLASVLFAGGILIGASMFMSTSQETAFAETQTAPLPTETLIAPPFAEAIREENTDVTPMPVSAPQSQGEAGDDTAPSALSDETAIGSEDLPQAGREVASAPALPEPSGRTDTQMGALTQPLRAIGPPSPPPPPRTTRSGEIPLPPPAPMAKSAPFAVQLGAFRIRENADTELSRLAGKGLDPLVIRRTSNDGNVWFYVRVGAYEDRARAKAAADRLKQTKAIIGFPVRAEPGEVILE